MADERPPIDGGDATDFEAAAKKVRAKAQGTKAAAGKARDTARGARTDLKDAERYLADLEREAVEAEKARKKLTAKQRDLLDRIARASEPPNYGGGRGGGVTQTQTSLERRGLIEWQKKQGTSNQGGYVLTGQGKSVDLEGIRGDISKQQRYVERLREDVAREVQSSAREETKAVQEEGRQVRKETTQRRAARTRRPKAPAAKPLAEDAAQAMRSYAAESAREEALHYREAASRALHDKQELARLKQMAPPGYDVEAVLRRQVAAEIPDGARGLASAHDLREQAIAHGANITTRVPLTGSKLPALENLRPTLESIRGQKGLEDLKQRGLFYPEEKPPPKITYNAAAKRQIDAENAARAEAAATAERTATVVAKAEDTKTKATQQGAAKRTKSLADERPPEGDIQELERVARQHNARMAAALDPTGRARLAAQQAPVTDAAQQERALRELEAARADSRPRSALQPRASAGGGSRGVIAHIDETERAAEAKIAKDLRRREDQRLLRAEATSRREAEKQAELARAETARRQQVGRLLGALGTRRLQIETVAARAAELEVEQRRLTARTEARAPGTDIVPRTLANAGARTRAEMGGGPLFGEYPYAPSTDLRRRNIGLPSDTPQPRAKDNPRDVYAQNPRRGRSSIGESAGEVQVLKAAAIEKARAARAEQGATVVAQRAAQQHADNLAVAAQAEATYAQRLAESEMGMRRWSAQLGVVDQGMRRHGTFTTEFISAAAKGEVAYREWGWQIGAAATKFAAWTAAGAGIYGAIGAAHQIGQGALQSASGVESLKRSVDNVDSGQAQQSFRDQAAHFNVPIEAVVDAQTRLGQVFHNQADAAKAAEAALYALQTGQVATEDSTKSLIAIQQAYGASAEDMVGLFDQLNFAQNEYGARSPDMLTGIGAAAGSFRQMGGSLEEVVAAMTVLQRHGTSGNIASTILRRIPNDLQKPENAGVLRGAGVDPTAPWGEMLKQAQTAVAGGADARALAAAMATPQWAGRLMNLLQDRKTYDEIRRRQAAGEPDGASETELGHVKAQATQVLKSIGIELGNLGSNLAQSGLATVFGSMAIALREVLSLTNTILSMWNQLPGVLKTSLAYAATGMVALAGARRLGIGGALEGTRAERAAPYLIESDARRTRRLVGKGLDDAVKATTDEAERHTTAAFRAAAERNQATLAERQVFSDTDQRLKAGAIDPKVAAERKAAAEAATAVAAEKAKDASFRATAAIEQAATQHKLRAELDELMANTARKDRNAVAQQWAIQQGMFIRPSLGADVPAAELVRRMEGGYAGPEGATPRTTPYVMPIGPLRQGERDTRQSVPPPSRIGSNRALADAADLANILGARGQTDQAKRVLPQVRNAMSKLGADMKAAKAAAGPTAAASVAGAAAARGASIGLTAVGTGLRGLMVGISAMLGPIGWIIAGLTILPSVIKAVQDAHREVADAGKIPAELPDTQGSLRAFNKKIDDQIKEANSFWGTVKNAFADGIDPRNWFSSPLSEERQRMEGWQGQKEAAKKQADQVAKARKEGRPATGLSGKQILEQSNRDVEDYKRGRIDLAELRKRQELRLKEILVAGANKKGATKGRAKDLEQQIEEIFKSANQEIQTRIESRFNLMRSLTDDPVEQARLDLQEAREKFKDAPDKTQAQADINNANRAYQEAIKAESEKRLQALGALVDAGAASGGQLRSYMAQQAAIINQFRNSTDPEDMQKYANARQALLSTLTNAGKQELDAALTNARTPQDINKAYREYERAGAQAARAAQTATKGRGDKKLAAQIKAVMRQRAQEQFEALAELADARTAVAAGNADAGLPRLQLQLQAIGRKVIGAIRVYGRSAKRTLQLIAEQQQARSAIVEAQGALIQAETGYAAAGLGNDPVAQGAINLAGLQRFLSFQQANPKVYDRAAVLGTMTAIKDARQAQADAIRQRAQDLADAQFALKASLNDDPVYQARLEAQRTAETVRRGGFTSPADKIRAQADANNARRNAQDAAVQAHIDDIDFDVEIGRKTHEQQIAAYQKLLNTSKMGQSKKKELEREIARLKHEAEQGSDEFQLDLGSIRLPSVYEVHRAIKEGRQSQGTVVNNSPQVTVNLAPGDDGSTVVRTLDRYLGTSARSAMRASADIGA